MKQINIYIGEQIKNIMLEKQITKAELARRLGIKPQSIEYLLKRKSVDTDTLYNISIALNHDFFRLYALKDNQVNFDIEKSDKIITRKKIVIELELTDEDVSKLGVQDKIKKLFK